MVDVCVCDRDGSAKTAMVYSQTRLEGALISRTKQQVLREQIMMGQEDTYTRHLDEARCQQNRQCILQIVHRALVDHFDTDQIKAHVQLKHGLVQRKAVAITHR
jgi:hypothetical protein